LLQFDTSEDIVRYILSIDSARELEDYLLELLNPEDESHLQFIKELIQRWKPKGAPNANVTVYQKEKEEEVYFAGTKPKEKKKKVKAEKRDEDDETRTQSNEIEEKTGAKKKTKYVELYSADGEARQEVRLPGRHACECQATKHKLISNCLSCGRIVCDQEGSGPCFFCGNLVCTKQEMELMNQGTKKAEQLKKKLLNDLPPKPLKSSSVLSHVSHVVKPQELPDKEAKIAAGLAKAQAHKDKLLEFDKTHTKRTHVIDDESDYYSTGTGSWTTQEEKEALQKKEEELRAKRFGSRLDRKITFDFAGRQILDDDDKDAAMQLYSEDPLAEKTEINKKNQELIAMLTEEHSRYLVNPSIKVPAPTFVGNEADSEKRSSTNKKEERARVVRRLQDKELMTLRDDGVCLSMHQPWASFLVKGIKKHEGRTWYSAHRGRLWIASTVKAPTAQEIIALETDYRHHYNRDIEFPNDYPTGVLLGCVDVADVLGQDDYKQKFGGNRQDPMESQSPFVFICENPQELFVKFPIKGQHKIYKLDNHVHQAAKKGARPVEAPDFDDNDDDEDDDEDREAAEAIRLVKMQQDFGGLQLGSEEIVGYA